MMLGVYRLGAAILAIWLVVSPFQAPLYAKTRKGDKLMKEGQKAESAQEWDKALSLYEQALATDFSDPSYLLFVRRARFQASQRHIQAGTKLRQEGNLEGALAEFQRAFAIDPSSSMAEQEAKRTYQMIQRNKKEGSALVEEDKGLTPAQIARRGIEEKMSLLRAVPELKPLNPQVSNLKMNNQNARVLFETAAKLAGINVLFDPDFLSSLQGKTFSLDITNSTIEEALDYLSLLTKAFWKPISPNAIFVTQDQQTKRRDFEDNVVKVFYLQNVTAAQELNEIAAALRAVTEIRRLLPYTSQMAIMVRGTADQVDLAQKLIYDLDKPKSEVVIDIMVMEANRTKTRTLGATLANGATPGINVPITYTRNGNPSTSTGDNSTGDNSNGSSNAGLATLSRLSKISTNDFSVAVPGAIVQALLNQTDTKVHQNPQLRTLDNVKATLKIGDRYPYATGSFQTGVATTVSPLVSTQFQFAEVGVNIDILPKIHGNNEVSLHVEVELSNISRTIDVGGLSQPVIGQRKIFEDVRLKEGEVSIMGGLSSLNDSRTTVGIPGLANIPGAGILFGRKGLDLSKNELLLVMVPRIVRAQDLNEVNLRTIATGNDQFVKLNYAPRPTANPPAAATTPAPGTTPAAPAPASAPPAATAPQADAGQTKLAFAPGTEKTTVGAPVTVSLEISDAKDLFSTPFRINYDPKLLKLTDVVRGSMMSSDNQPVSFTRDVNSGVVKISRLPGAPGINGSGELVKLTFQPLAKGTATVSVEDALLQDSKMQPVNATRTPLTIAIE